MNRILYMLLAIFLIFSGCQKSSSENNPPNGFLQNEELELYVSQFGVPFEEARKNLGLSENDLTDEGYGEWRMAATRKIGEMDFSQKITMLDGNLGTEWDGDVYRFDCICREEINDNTSIDDLREKGFSIALLARETYGEPATDPGVGDRIFDESGNLNQEIKEHYIENWRVSEDTTVSLNLFLDDKAILVYVCYRPTRLTRWREIYPGQ